MSASRSARTKQIPIRTITDDDLRFSLRQGWEDFRDLRGDLFFAGLIYTLIGLAAVVMTTSRPLMPFFFPVVAGVGAARTDRGRRLLRARAAAREWRGSPLVQFPRRAQAPVARRHGDRRRACCCVIFVGWLIAAGALYALLFGWATPTSIGGFLSAGLHDSARLGVDRRRRGRRRDLRLVRACAQRRLAADAGRLRRQRGRGGLRLMARGARQQGRDDPLGDDRRRCCWCSARSRCSSASPSCCRGSAIRPGTSTRAWSTARRSPRGARRD